ncbi:MAG: hypothetical protein DRR16_26090 [Candidatus Parabeggiatoa sp. nov. 3]|nr:MAG: hypothetical protein DRR00_29215 [Gammaproteobacteria bacterium]RKZ57154.1 MAG: hypothetical protein DRQ99_27395 [Gammaproteobacteria bacterium]RKZ79235.1 MAG: hypothetical protein DRR16_26090 [Gammaproteobacteria bacterium]HEW98707.1 hypothetical protein [Beggiatoa sp.]
MGEYGIIQISAETSSEQTISQFMSKLLEVYNRNKDSAFFQLRGLNVIIPEGSCVYLIGHEMAFERMRREMRVVGEALNLTITVSFFKMSAAALAELEEDKNLFKPGYLKSVADNRDASGTVLYGPDSLEARALAQQLMEQYAVSKILTMKFSDFLDEGTFFGGGIKLGVTRNDVLEQLGCPAITGPFGTRLETKLFWYYDGICLNFLDNKVAQLCISFSELSETWPKNIYFEDFCPSHDTTWKEFEQYLNAHQIKYEILPSEYQVPTGSHKCIKWVTHRRRGLEIKISKVIGLQITFGRDHLLKAICYPWDDVLEWLKIQPLT